MTGLKRTVEAELWIPMRGSQVERENRKRRKVWTEHGDTPGEFAMRTHTEQSKPEQD